jgi:hypothetical protein
MITKLKLVKKSTKQTMTVIGYIILAVAFSVLILKWNPPGTLAATKTRISTEDNKTANEPTEFEKEAITSIREITIQLILITGGIYALVGGFVAAKNKSKRYHCRWAIRSSFIILAVSIALGFLAYGGIIFDLSSGIFQAGGTAQQMAARQWLAFFSGGFLLIVFLVVNID